MAYDGRLPGEAGIAMITVPLVSPRARYGCLSG